MTVRIYRCCDVHMIAYVSSRYYNLPAQYEIQRLHIQNSLARAPCCLSNTGLNSNVWIPWTSIGSKFINALNTNWPPSHAVLCSFISHLTSLTCSQFCKAITGHVRHCWLPPTDNTITKLSFCHSAPFVWNWIQACLHQSTAMSITSLLSAVRISWLVSKLFVSLNHPSIASEPMHCTHSGASICNRPLIRWLGEGGLGFNFVSVSANSCF